MIDIQPEDIPRRIPQQKALRAVDHDEARRIVQRLISASFRRDGERLPAESCPRFSIPCREEHDDDCLILAYIDQCEAEHAAHDARIAELLAANNREGERRRGAEAIVQTLARDVRRIVGEAETKADAGVPLDQVLVWLIAGIGASIGIAERDRADA